MKILRKRLLSIKKEKVIGNGDIKLTGSMIVLISRSIFIFFLVANFNSTAIAIGVASGIYESTEELPTINGCIYPPGTTISGSIIYSAFSYTWTINNPPPNTEEKCLVYYDLATEIYNDKIADGIPTIMLTDSGDNCRKPITSGGLIPKVNVYYLFETIKAVDGYRFVNFCGSLRDIRVFDLAIKPNKRPSGDSCSSAQGPAVEVGDPIIVATGNSFQTEIDYQSSRPFGLKFIRYFNSTGTDVNNGLGIKWSHNFRQRVVKINNTAYVSRAGGQAYTFNFDGTHWLGDVDIPDTLEEVLDGNNVRTGWVYTDSNDTVETYNAEGQLLTITNRAGQSQTLVYDVTIANGGDDNSVTLDKVISYTGDELAFTYDSSQRISSMTDPEGNVYSYQYDSFYDRPIKVTYPDGRRRSYSYNYINSRLYHLSSLTDETGSRVTWAYDTQGRAISSELDGGVDKFTLDYRVADQVTVTNPLGKDTTYHFTTLHGVKKVTQVEGHPTANCAGANQNYTYDANGYLQSKTDWQGNVTNYIHDARGLETSRTEAVGTPQERTITTTWHPDFRVPLTITEPGKVTTYTYDGVGRRLTRIISE